MSVCVCLQALDLHVISLLDPKVERNNKYFIIFRSTADLENFQNQPNLQMCIQATLVEPSSI